MSEFVSRIKGNRVSIIGVPITATNMDEVLDTLLNHHDEIRGEYVCVSNVHTTVMAYEQPSYLNVQASSLMSIPDGKPLSVLGSKKVPTMARVTGPDLMRAIFENSTGRTMRHYFYGSTQNDIDALLSALKTKYSGINIVGSEPSLFRPMSDKEKLDLSNRINSAKADFVWVALGAPRQENLCFDLKGRTDSVMIGVGGAFNILSGKTPEAPLWMQNMSLEWLYRFAQEPRRLFKRYAVTNTKFIYYCVRYKINNILNKKGKNV